MDRIYEINKLEVIPVGVLSFKTFVNCLLCTDNGLLIVSSKDKPIKNSQLTISKICKTGHFF